MIRYSILICSIPNRLNSASNLYDILQKQIGNRKDIEVLCLTDNKNMTIGEKRNMLLSCARGAYLSFLDDDDTISDDFIPEIMKILDDSSPDVVTFKQHCTVNGIEFYVDFSLKNPNEPAILENGKYKNIRRKPYHMCVWKSVIAKNTNFLPVSYGEDFDWINRLSQRCRTEIKIDKVLHYYIYSDTSSESIQFAGKN